MKDLAPVEPIDVPSRYSQTMLRHFNRCHRSAYLYRKYRGGGPSHAMHRGTAFHRFAEKAVNHLIDQAEPRLPFEVAKDMMAETIATSTDLVVPAEEQGHLRVMAYHFAEGVVINPDEVVSVEQSYVLELDGGITVICKPDIVFRRGETLVVWDYKSAMAMASFEEIAEKLADGRRSPKSFQLLLYILAVAQGSPATEVECNTCQGDGRTASTSLGAPPGEAIDCPDCEGRGNTLVLGESISSGVQYFDGFEKYPMFLFDDGMAERGPLSVHREELVDHRIMLEGLAYKLEEKWRSWDFPAVPGSHCVECPASSECPLPEALRDHAGTINTVEEAQEAATAIYIRDVVKKPLAKELRNWSKLHGMIPYGRDRLRVLETVEKRSYDREAMAAGAIAAAETGGAFDPEDYAKVSRYQEFKDRVRRPEDVVPVDVTDFVEGSGFGDEPPF